MHSIATCPQCAAQLALPTAATASDYAICPECNAEFSLGEGDLRWLATAKLIPPPEETKPQEVVAEPAVESAEQIELSTQQTIELSEPDELSEPELAEPPESSAIEETAREPLQPELPEEIAPETRTLNLSNAETLVANSALSDWEERLKSAMDLPTEPVEEPTPEHEAASKERTPLEDAPEFDFHMDPPAEKPQGPTEVPAEELTKTAEWFQSAAEENVERVELTINEPEEESQAPEEVELPSAEPVEVADAEPVAAEEKPQPLRKRRKQNSLMRVASVFTLFGVLGLLLGQYVLLWFWGPTADYIGLASVVPRSLRPSATSQLLAPQIAPEETLASVVQNLDADAIESATAGLLADQEPPAETSDHEFVHDNSVVPASTDSPVETEIEAEKPLVLLPPSGTTVAEFSTLLDSAQRSLPAFLGGDLSSKEAKASKGQAYMAFCRLADKSDILASQDAPEAISNQAEAAKSMFRSITQDPAAARENLAYIAGKWWTYSQRPSSGIVLIGRIENVQSLDGYAVYQLSLAGTAPDETIPVAVAGAEYRIGDSLGIAGTIIADPQQSLPNFTLELPQVVVSHFAF